MYAYTATGPTVLLFTILVDNWHYQCLCTHTIPQQLLSHSYLRILALTVPAAVYRCLLYSPPHPDLNPLRPSPFMMSVVHCILPSWYHALDSTLGPLALVHHLDEQLTSSCLQPYHTVANFRPTPTTYEHPLVASDLK